MAREKNFRPELVGSWLLTDAYDALPIAEAPADPEGGLMTRIEFRNHNLAVMDRKVAHWSLSAFRGLVRKRHMIRQFKSEYGAFVKNFPDYLQGALDQCPIPEVCSELEENIAEERYGAGARKILIKLKEDGIISYVPEDTSHPELFKLIPKGLGFDVSDFDTAPLPPKAEAYRRFLWEATHAHGWEVAVVIATIFLEGKHDWEVFPEDFPERTPHTPVQDMRKHALAVYGATADHLMLTLVHHEFEGAHGGHRLAAWTMALDHIAPDKREKVVHFMQEALRYYNDWRDEIAEACGLVEGPDGAPHLREEVPDAQV